MRAYKQSDLAALKTSLVKHRWRQAILLRGERAWCFEQLSYLRRDITEPWYILSRETALTDGQWPTHLHQILGQEHANVVYDCFSGFYADKLAALSGTVQAGGILVMLLPEDTSCFLDPGIEKFLSHGYSAPEYSLFWRWLEHTLPNTSFISICQSASETVQLPNCSDSCASQPYTPGAQQQQAIDEIIDTACASTTRPLLISADRGRGKSAALGIAAAKLSDKKIILCAIQRKAVSSAFKHLAQHCEAHRYDDGVNHLENLTFMPPDRVLAEQPACDVLFVDEAATIPVHILKRLLLLYPRVVFASTLAGYEGSGRGYTLRFKTYLDKHYPLHRECSLTEPFRFAPNDPLEQGINQLLILDAANSSVDINTSTVRYQHCTINELVENSALLKEVFALLVLAHYQTSANDFRQLLDAPGQRIYLALQGQQLVGVALVMLEGDFPLQLAAEVAQGKRRPQGHMLIQSLATLAGEAKIAALKGARVSRIAIHPSVHHLGLGSALIAYIEKDLIDLNVDIFGTSFGAHASLVQFWQRAGMKTVKLGFKKDHVSAQHSILMVKTLSRYASDTLTSLYVMWQRDLPEVLAYFFPHISNKLKDKLEKECTHSDCLLDDANTLERFLKGELSFIQLYAPLKRYLAASQQRIHALPQAQQDFIEQLYTQNNASIMSVYSKKQFQSALMTLVEIIVEAHHD
ncbi:GNAT family N-acetyltransferase [Pseudoalteromonas sp. SSDWG2]|uniref:GNAT family N-acetyltransferase n=1 Tax=Pseudoalteromonas sp. SSDWG2 TaxID=3139391 RepID=UPI003BA92F71